MLVSLTVGKVDAGVTVLLTQDKRLIEFPSILLPPNISSGSIVDIAVSRNRASETTAEAAFASLQKRILDTFGTEAPAAPVLRCRNATQTSVVLEWDPIRMATADLLGLALYRNGQKAGNIPRPLQMHSTKISGLAVDTAYTFHLVLRTSAGTLTSDRVAVRTHKMTDLSGITISTGILPVPARQRLAAAVDRIGARLVTESGLVRIDTTHFVTTEGRGLGWEKATEVNIPVVRPEWVEACEASGRILGVTKFYLDAVRLPNDSTDESAAAAAVAATAASATAAAAAAAAAATSSPKSPPAPPRQQQQPQQKQLSTKTVAPAPAPPPPPAPMTPPRRDDTESSSKRGSSSASSSSSVAKTPADGKPPDKATVEQNMALRPADSAKSNSQEAQDKDDDDDDDDEEDEDADVDKAEKEDTTRGNGKKPLHLQLQTAHSVDKLGELKPSTPGDGGSFQDVAL
ncbi:chitin biosynthesis protein [Grosmannia clavigera kw1407]|uniref:Chitin biosynthesis protein n=1 Tax=Grosmannia clavigera (strain kw1407 / UAMH 11150) TaxID=655863 RepID=F0XK58_GROCL|nr:chitin biosynthesis protein [Grosmannia clavigera kw1407]EFX01981.1 chitin biosynthesis protein [Grosmannia clavigera kw1407]